MNPKHAHEKRHRRHCRQRCFSFCLFGLLPQYIAVQNMALQYYSIDRPRNTPPPPLSYARCFAPFIPGVRVFEAIGAHRFARVSRPGYSGASGLQLHFCIRQVRNRRPATKKDYQTKVKSRFVAGHAIWSPSTPRQLTNTTIVSAITQKSMLYLRLPLVGATIQFPASDLVCRAGGPTLELVTTLAAHTNSVFDVVEKCCSRGAYR